MTCTEHDAAMAYGHAWNTLDCRCFLNLLADDARYASQWVYDELEGKAAISDYLIKKMQNVKQSGSKVQAELGLTRNGPVTGRPCIILTQGDVQVAVVFEVQDGKISRFDLCVLEFFSPQPTGVLP